MKKQVVGGDDYMTWPFNFDTLLAARHERLPEQ